VFVELMPLLKDRKLLLTIARVGEKVKVNVIPAKAKEGEDQALTTPLTYTASPEELDAELAKTLPAMLTPMSRSAAPWPKQRLRWTRQRRPHVKKPNRHRLRRPIPL